MWHSADKLSFDEPGSQRENSRTTEIGLASPTPDDTAEVSQGGMHTHMDSVQEIISQKF